MMLINNKPKPARRNRKKIRLLTGLFNYHVRTDFPPLETTSYINS